MVLAPRQGVICILFGTSVQVSTSVPGGGQLVVWPGPALPAPLYMWVPWAQEAALTALPNHPQGLCLHPL